jgi:hypothetical protein
MLAFAEEAGLDPSQILHAREVLAGRDKERRKR